MAMRPPSVGLVARHENKEPHNPVTAPISRVAFIFPPDNFIFPPDNLTINALPSK